MKNNETVYLNGFCLATLDPNVILTSIFTLFNDLQWRSYESLKEIYISSIEDVINLCYEMGLDKSIRGSNRAKLTRFANEKRKVLRFIPKTREILLAKIYEMILRVDGLSPLAGFGMTNRFGDNLKGDPERQSLYDS